MSRRSRPPKPLRPAEVGAGDGPEDARFADADGETSRAGFERINCGLIFDRVRQVRYRGFDLARRDEILNLLTLEQDATGVTLVFSNQASIRLEGRGMVCHLEDLGEPWPAGGRPDHDAAPQGET